MNETPCAQGIQTDGLTKLVASIIGQVKFKEVEANIIKKGFEHFGLHYESV